MPDKTQLTATAALRGRPVRGAIQPTQSGRAAMRAAGRDRDRDVVQVRDEVLLTGVTILAIGWLDPGDGSAWRVAFALLALGPLVGIIAMWRLRRRPEAFRMANGHR